jgi:pimeloyl-ACP methyl ester carboxylesterase
VLLFLHGFPEAAFVWDDLLEHFSRPENGGYRCVAPNLRGFEPSAQPPRWRPTAPSTWRRTCGADPPTEGAPLAAWWRTTGAARWPGTWPTSAPELMRRLVIVNSPHPGTFLRELQTSPAQQAASAYMNFLIRPDAEALLREDDYRRMWGFFAMGGGAGLAHRAVKQQYRAVWDARA